MSRELTDNTPPAPRWLYPTLAAITVACIAALIAMPADDTNADDTLPAPVYQIAAVPSTPIDVEQQPAPTDIGVTVGAQATATAHRLTPPTTAAAPTTLPVTAASLPGESTIAGRCTQWDPNARSTTQDSGLAQINDVNHAYLTTALGEHVDAWTLFDPVQNIRAAAALCTYWQRAGEGCYYAWRGGA